MSVILDVAILAIAITAVIVALVYIGKASTSITSISKWDANPDLFQARTYLKWTTIISSILIAIVVLGLITIILFGPQLLFVWGGMLIIGLILIMIGFAIAAGVLASISAYYIRQSGEGETGFGYNAFIYCVIAAAVSLGTVTILVVSIIIYLVRKSQEDKKRAQAQAAIRRLQTERYIKKLQADVTAKEAPVPTTSKTSETSSVDKK